MEFHGILDIKWRHDPIKSSMITSTISAILPADSSLPKSLPNNIIILFVLIPKNA